MPRVSASISKQVAASQEWKCKKCVTTLSSAFQIDHIIPKCQGGTNDVSNLQALCPNCHALKTQKEPKPARKVKIELPTWWPKPAGNGNFERNILKSKHLELMSKDPSKLTINELKIFVFIKTTKICDGNKKDLLKILEEYEVMYKQMFTQHPFILSRTY